MNEWKNEWMNQSINQTNKQKQSTDEKLHWSRQMTTYTNKHHKTYSQHRLKNELTDDWMNNEQISK